jgi:hypothetical protein
MKIIKYTYVCKMVTDPENPTGRPSLDQPTFTDLEPRSAGDSDDGYIWKYLYNLSSRMILLSLTQPDFMPVPNDWYSNSQDAAVRNNATTSGQLKIVTITNRGVGLGTANRTYTKVPIKGDGSGGPSNYYH